MHRLDYHSYQINIESILLHIYKILEILKRIFRTRYQLIKNSSPLVKLLERESYRGLIIL